ncbi:two-component sensor histidine kinase [Vibrio sp. 1151_11]|nr:two-component sensor histidine kinase [Vibrio sp. 1151_11]
MKNKKIFSIKRRLTQSAVWLSGGLLLISLYFSFSTAQHEVEEVYDARLGQSAKLLLMATSVSIKEGDNADLHQQFDQWMQSIERLSQANKEMATQYGHPYERYILFQFYRDGQLMYSSDSQQPAFSTNASNNGFGSVTIDGQTWRYFQLAQPHPDRGSEYILVAEKQSIRDEMVNEIALSTALPQLILIPCVILVLVMLIGRSFKPLQELKSAIAIRSVHKLDRIYVTEQTTELSPLVETLNQLLAQLELAWQREKRFTRMAAHELKTPLTVLRLNAENAMLSQNEQQLKYDLDMILKGIERTDRLIHQLLMLAKVESTMELSSQTVDLSVSIKQVIADLAPLALKHDQQLSFEGQSLSVQGDELLLGVLFKNLIDNAMRYSGVHSHIDITLHGDDQFIQVNVTDSGPNITNEAREKIFDNFYRANSEKGDGAGLGMSICRDIAALHNATVELLPRHNDSNIFRVCFHLS